MQINRLLEIVYILLRQKTVTARELAERFGVSQRTIYRDVDTLSLASIPIYTEKGKGGGISLLPEFVLSKSLFSEQEQHEILSALQGLSSIKTDETDQVLSKLSTLFNKPVHNWLEVDFTDWGYRNGHYFNGFKTAILERRIAEFDYYSTFVEKTHRRIEPIQLWFKSKSWYIKGYCLLRQDIRLFKLARVKDLVITNEHFPERDLLAIPSTNPDIHEKRDITVKLIIAAEMAYRVYDEFDEEHTQIQPDGSFHVTLMWPEDEWVYSYLLSFGEYIEVLEPEYIRNIVREKARVFCEKHL